MLLFVDCELSGLCEYYSLARRYNQVCVCSMNKEELVKLLLSLNYCMSLIIP